LSFSTVAIPVLAATMPVSAPISAHVAVEMPSAIAFVARPGSFAPPMAALAAPADTPRSVGTEAPAPTIVVTLPTPDQLPPANPDAAGEPAAEPAGVVPPNTVAPDASAPAGAPIVVTARTPSKDDPVQALNIASFQAVQAVDEAIIKPIETVYTKVVPTPVRKGLHNFLDNLDEPIVFLNFLLQLKPGKALETLGRFAINSTLGIGGLIDVAKNKPFNLPRRSNGLADTLAYYGVGPGPYLFLPVIGATTVRDLIARPFDLAVLPTFVGKPFSDPKVALGKGVLNALDEREQMDETITRIRASDDPYVAMRQYYLDRRKREIEVLKGLRPSIDQPRYDEMDKQGALGKGTLKQSDGEGASVSTQTAPAATGSTSPQPATTQPGTAQVEPAPETPGTQIENPMPTRTEDPSAQPAAEPAPVP